jgi:hypothetical protein
VREEYTVIIKPVPDANAESVAWLTIRLDASEPLPRIVELALRSSARDGLTGVSVPDFNLQGIIAALHSGLASSDNTDKDSIAPDSRRTASTYGATQPLLKPGAAIETPPTAEPATPQAHGETSHNDSKGRAYRRMPPPLELRGVHERVGTITAVATHYGVPRHTAQGWIARLRNLERRDGDSIDSTNE